MREHDESPRREPRPRGRGGAPGDEPARLREQVRQLESRLRSRAHAERRQTDRIRAAQDRVLEMIARGAPLGEVLEALVLTIEARCEGTMGSVLLVDADGRRLRHGAAPNLPEAYNRAVDGVSIGPREGSCGTAAHRRELVVVEDIGVDPLWADYRELARSHGLRACWSQPILGRDGAVRGTFAMYYHEPRRPSGEDREFLEVAAHLAGIAIERDGLERCRRSAEQRFRRQAAVLVDLARSEQLAQHDFDAVAKLATETAGRTLGVERTGIWLFHEERTILRCLDLYELSGNRHSSGVELEARDFPAYFAALERGRTVAADDAHTHPDTREFSEGYLSPLGISSMLDAPLRRGGEVIGVVCHEHVGLRRHWAPEEQDFAASVADFVALALETRERRRAEARLHEQQRRERERVEAELERVREELVRKTRLAAIGQIAASIAHELRNPLGAIQNAHYYLTRRIPEGEPKWAEYMEIIGQEIRAADRIISNFMEMSRSREPARRPVDLGRTIREAWEHVKEPERLRLRVTLEPDPFTIEADPDQLRQVLGNLFSNAARALRGRGEISVAACREDDGVAITVADDGPGVPAELRERVFQPLVTGRADGTGLGLAICRQIVEAHGGTIDLLAPAGRGAAFRVRLPDGGRG